VGDFNTEIYSWNTPHGTYTFWVSKDFPNYSKIKGELDKLNQAAAAGVGQGAIGADYGSLPGMAVKTVVELAGQKITTTVLSVKEAPVDDAIFEIPKDYHQIAQPGLPQPGTPAVPK
jgi:hypothetical protein